MLEDGWTVGEIGWFGLQGHPIEYQDHKIYPAMRHTFGSDAIVHHSKDFGANVIFTMQDIWALDQNDLRQLKTWIPYCLDGKIKVSFVDGREIPIKEVVENKIEDKVWGYKDGKVVPSKIKAWQDIPEKMDVYEIKTKSSKILITGNNEVWVTSIINKASSMTVGNDPEWKRADGIIPGDMVYCNSSGQKSNKDTKVNSNRMGLFSWFNRWRGDYLNKSSQKEQGQIRNLSSNSSSYNYFGNKRGNDSLGWRENRGKIQQQTKKYWECLESCLRQTNQVVKNLLSGSSLGLQLLPNFSGNITLFNYQKGALSDRNRFSSFSDAESKGRKQGRQELYQRGNRFVGESSDLEPQIVVAVRKVKAPKRRVYDISTETGNFFASKILVHNCPIDKDPAPQGVLNNLNYAYRIVTFSQFGQDELEKANFTSRLILEGTDTEIFKPVDKTQARKELGIPQDCFLFSIIGANKENPPRKGHQESLTAFKMFADKHPEARLLFSCQQPDPGGFPIQGYAAYLKILDKLIFTDEYATIFKFTSEDINKFYNASDVLLHPSQTEGFGLCIVEAQSCGIPVVIQNVNSMPALIQEGKTGWGATTIYKQFRNDLGFTNIADPNSVYSCMERAYKAVKENPEQLKKDCRDWVVQNYNINTIYKEKWIPLLEQIQEEILPPTLDKDPQTTVQSK